ncbi:MAG: hypothetical protein ABSF69_13335 [Polyangiaceae bacterium]|jgi:hypothetical protein
MGAFQYVRLVLVQYPGELPLREARRIYFATNHFGDDGGTEEKAGVGKIGEGHVEDRSSAPTSG